MKEPIFITFNNRKFVYSFNDLSAEAGELAREAGEFKAMQSEGSTDSFNNILRSGGADWLFTICRYLFREEINGILQSYERGKAETQTDKWLRELPLSDVSQLKEVVEDFFCGLNLETTASMLLQPAKNMSVTKMLLPLITGMNSKLNIKEKMS